MKRDPLIRNLTLFALGVLLLGTVGCYSKVVGAKGIGGDSEKLRKNHEFGSPSPLHDIVERDEKR